jgi:RNase adapter protein RapZ
VVKDLQFVIVSGLSGSGKSHVLKCFEDLGFFCVDNLPPPLLPKFAELCVQSTHGVRQVALGIDIRERDFLDEFFSTFEKLRGLGYHMEMLFLEARDEVLVRRFSETRRPHPLAKEKPVVEGIRLERQRLSELRNRADQILDTSDYSVHQLKEVISHHFGRERAGHRLHVTLISFGFKFGIPYELDLLFDVRFLPNPNFVEELRSFTGKDSRVTDYILQWPEAKAFLESLYQMLELTLPLYEREGRSYLTVGIGCTGGLHRSVALVEKLRDFLKTKGYDPDVRHRDIGQQR